MNISQCGFNEYFDIFSSEDKVTTKLQMDNKFTDLTLAEVHTQKESTDEDGHTTYYTVFHGLVGKFELPKNLNSNIFVRSNYRVGRWNKSKVKMDMSAFEKLFDVEADEEVLAMRILTSDVMTEIIDIYSKYKYSFEISIINNMVYIRMKSGSIFEPNVFGKALKYKEIEKFYLLLKSFTELSKHLYKTIEELEV